MTGGAPALSSAARKARLVRAFLGGEPVHCTVRGFLLGLRTLVTA